LNSFKSDLKNSFKTQNRNPEKEKEKEERRNKILKRTPGKPFSPTEKRARGPGSLLTEPVPSPSPSSH
jgi:hypothetical protein